MNIALHDSDKTNFPNLVLMKLSAWHKAQGDSIEKYLDEMSITYDKVYSSKVFTFTNEEQLYGSVEKGGTGYGNKNILPEKIEHICPDYSLYGLNYSLGFTTRGCIRKCEDCFVPEKEGDMKDHAEIEEFVRHKEVVLMDNNILASKHGIKQIESIINRGLKLDINQGLDARLIDAPMAKLLSKVKWLKPLRLACDSQIMKEPLRKAVELLRWYNTKPTRYFVYVLVKEVDEAADRLKFLKGLSLDPFAQPYRDKKGTEPTKAQKDLARWVNHKATFKSVWWENYKN
jgi:hypothetical protein